MTSRATAESHFEAGALARNDKLWEQAAKEYRQAIELDPTYALAYQELGFLTYGKTGTLTEAENLLQEAITLDPSLGEAHMYLAIVLGRLGEHDRARVHFVRATEIMDDSALAHATYGEYLYVHKDAKASKQQFRLALKVDPGCLPALRDYGRFLSSVGRHREAESFFKKALALSDDRWSNHRYGAFLANIDGRAEEAERLLRRAVELDPSYEGAIEDLEGLLRTKERLDG